MSKKIVLAAVVVFVVVTGLPVEPNGLGTHGEPSGSTVAMGPLIDPSGTTETAMGPHVEPSGG